MVTPSYGQRKTLGQNNCIPMIREHLTEKACNGHNHRVKKMCFIEMIHIEVSVVKPAARAQIPLNFKGQIT